jgi:RNA polymerase sigma factor (sigma-70 family)
MVKLRDNAAMLQAFRRGDRAALEAVYSEYSQQLFAMLKEGFAIESSEKRYLFEGYREPWHLETAAQEIFTRAFSPNARTAYDGLRPYKNYLFTIARNYVVDTFRKAKRSFVSLDDVPEEKQGETDDVSLEKRSGPEDFAISGEIQGLVRQFIASLDAFEKKVFDLRFVTGMSVETSAREAKVSEYRIKRTERKIKFRFYHYMKRRGYFEGFHYSDITLKMFVLLVVNAGGVA